CQHQCQDQSGHDRTYLRTAGSGYSCGLQTKRSPTPPRSPVATDPRSCPHCGTTLPVEAHFCLNCGRPTPTEPGVPPRTMPTGAVEVSRVRKALADRYQVERVLGEGGM